MARARGENNGREVCRRCLGMRKRLTVCVTGGVGLLTYSILSRYFLKIAHHTRVVEPHPVDDVVG
ncbi:MAG: hypothetical protein IH585_20995 [Anaerolineaceae bacterium]|nr:hypothetical protein [Anaerolineaceae bacterium]